jgi:hypothetical protein
VKTEYNLAEYSERPWLKNGSFAAAAADDDNNIE